MQLPSMRFLRRFVAVTSAVALAAAPSFATWSIVVVNTRTREACIGSATCISNFNLRKNLAVLRPGLGAACSQAAIDSGATNRNVMYAGFGNGLSPQQILAQLLTIPAFDTRQFGIVDFEHSPVTYSGASTFAWAGGVTGEVGDLRYAIQGNILVGAEPVLNAELALLNTQGDITQKVMAAMEAARAWGGDGRCSCSVNNPTSCGSPPPVPFVSSHAGFVLLARVDDTGGTMCGTNTGCAFGNFFLQLNIIAPGTDPDPVLQMAAQYATWRAGLAGRTDQLTTRVSAGAQALVADGVTKTTVVIELRDIDGVDVGHGGHTLTLTNLSGASAVTTSRSSASFPIHRASRSSSWTSATPSGSSG